MLSKFRSVVAISVACPLLLAMTTSSYAQKADTIIGIFGKIIESKLNREAENKERVRNIKRAQIALKTLGYYDLKIDGNAGPSTNAAIRNYLRDFGLASFSLDAADLNLLERNAQSGIKSARNTNNFDSGGTTSSNSNLTTSAFPQIDQAIANLAQNLGSQLFKAGRKRIAIDGFSDLNGFESALGDFISEELTTSLFSVGGFTIVERNEFERVLNEHQRYSNNLYDPGTISELGKFLGIDALVTGTITSFSDRIKVNARAIDIETGGVFAAANVSVRQDRSIAALASQRSRFGDANSTGNRQANSQPVSAQFENSFIRVTPTAVSLGEFKEKLKIPVEITNIANRDLYLTGYTTRPFATSNFGEEFEAQMKGMRQANYNLDWIQMRPGNKITVLYDVASKNRNPIQGNNLSLRHSFLISMDRRRNKEYQEMFFNLNGISIR